MDMDSTLCIEQCSRWDYRMELRLYRIIAFEGCQDCGALVD